MVGGQPVAVAMDLEPELRVDAFGRPLTVAAQIARRPVLDEPGDVGIERGFALSARRHRAVAEQRVHLGAAEGQGRGQRAFERHGMRVRADRGGHQHARAASRGGARGLPALRIGGDQLTPVRIGAGTRVVPAPRQPRRAPEPREAADAVLHAGRAPIDQAGKLLGRRQLAEGAPRTMRFELVERVAAGRDRNRPRADGVGALDVVRRVADDEHAIIGNRTRRARQLQRACGNASPGRPRPRRTRRRGSSGTGRSA